MSDKEHMWSIGGPNSQRAKKYKEPKKVLSKWHTPWRFEVCYIWGVNMEMMADLVSKFEVDDDEKHGIVIRIRGAGRGMTVEMQKQLANHIIACVNACGDVDPKKIEEILKGQTK